MLVTKLPESSACQLQESFHLLDVGQDYSFNQYKHQSMVLGMLNMKTT